MKFESPNLLKYLNFWLIFFCPPQVGDFGLARWQPDGQSSVETRVLGTFGYGIPNPIEH
jgi:hypothetical protein